MFHQLGIRTDDPTTQGMDASGGGDALQDPLQRGLLDPLAMLQWQTASPETTAAADDPPRGMPDLWYRMFGRKDPAEAAAEEAEFQRLVKERDEERVQQEADARQQRLDEEERRRQEAADEEREDEEQAPQADQVATAVASTTHAAKTAPSKAEQLRKQKWRDKKTGNGAKISEWERDTDGGVGESGGDDYKPDRASGTLGRAYDAAERKSGKDGADFNGDAAVLTSKDADGQDRGWVGGGAFTGDGFFGDDASVDDYDLWKTGRATGTHADAGAGAAARGGAHVTGFDDDNRWERGGEASVGAAIEGKAGVGGDIGAIAASQDTRGRAEASADVGVFAGAQGHAGAEGWLKGTEVGVSAEAAGSLGVGAKGRAGASAAGGPEIGAVDPATGKRKHLASAGAEVSGDAFVGAEGGAKAEASLSPTGFIGTASIDGSIGARASGAARGGARLDAGGFTLAGVEAGVSGDAFVGAKGSAEGRVEAGLLGVSASGSASAEVAARVSGEADAALTFLGGTGKAKAAGSAELSALAGAEGQIGSGWTDLGASGSAEAFAGVKAGGSISGSTGFLGVDFLTGSLEGEVAAGAGVGVGGGVYIKDGIVTLSANFLAAGGVGGSLGGSLSIDLLAAFKGPMKLLAANGVVNADPNQWIPEIVGYSTGALKFAERSGSGTQETHESELEMKKRFDEELARTAQGLDGKSSASGSKDTLADGASSTVPGALRSAAAPPGLAEAVVTAAGAPATLGLSTAEPAAMAVDPLKAPLAIAGAGPGDAETLGEIKALVQGAGGQMNPATGSINMLSKAADPAALMGDLPGDVGKKHDAAVASAMSTLQTASGLSQQAAVETQTGLGAAMEALKTELANPVQLFQNVVQAGLDAVGNLVTEGLNSAGEFIGGIVNAAGQTLRSVAELIGSLVQALFGEITNLFGGYNQGSNDLAASFMNAADNISGGIANIKTGKILDAKAMLTNTLLGVAASFSDRAGGAFESAKQKSDQADALVTQVQTQPMDLGVGKGTFAVDNQAQGQFKEVSRTIGLLTGAADQSAGALGEAGPELAATADAAAATTDDSAREADQGMHETFDGPKANKDQEVAAEKAAADKRMAEFKADPVGTTITTVAKAGWDWLTSLFTPKK